MEVREAKWSLFKEVLMLWLYLTPLIDMLEVVEPRE
jgi:hypothetical protein